MATESTAFSNEPGSSAKVAEQPASSEPPPASERRGPAARETLLPASEADPAFPFEPHDTIPAPPWLGDDEASESGT
jgi:hypothetical protein